MLKFVVIQPGQPDREVLVQGDVATIGRVQPCDVVIDKPFVSKQHLRILRGTVAIDLGSSNGTYVDGRRLSEAVLLEAGRTLTLSQNGVQVRVEVPAEARPARAASDADHEALRTRHVALEVELAQLRNEVARANDPAAQETLLGRLKGENASLRKRLDSLKAELEQREVDDGDSVQAKLAMQRVESVQDLNEKLQKDVTRLRAELADLETRHASAIDAAQPNETSDDSSELRSELERLRESLEREKAAAREHGDQAEQIRGLKTELAALRAANESAARPTRELEEALETSRVEAKEFRARVAELEGELAEAAPAPQKNVSDLFFKLQAENTELRRKVAAIDKGAAPSGAPAPRETKHVKELMEARMRIAALEAELAKGGAAKGAVAKVTAIPSRAVEAPAPAERSATRTGDVRKLLKIVVDKDVEGLPREKGAPVDEFVLAESVRFLRQVERVVTRMAGDLIQLFRLQTMLPDTVGSYRDIVSELLAKPDDAAARECLVDYLEKLGRWLVASIGAHRKAAVLVAAGMKEDLSETGLTAKDPLPPYARVPMLAGNELWRRTQTYLQALSPDAIDERVEQLARAQAQLILNESS